MRPVTTSEKEKICFIMEKEEKYISCGVEWREKLWTTLYRMHACTNFVFPPPLSNNKQSHWTQLATANKW